MSEVTKFGLCEISRGGEHWSEIKESKSGNFVHINDYETLELQYNAVNMEAKEYCDELFELRDELASANAKIAELQAVVDDTSDDPYSFTTYCSNLIYEYDKEIEALKLQLEQAEKVIEFYANDAFRELEPNSGYEIFLVNEDKADVNGTLTGGKLARSYLTTKTHGEL
jgi:hypothetical protein